MKGNRCHASVRRKQVEAHPEECVNVHQFTKETEGMRERRVIRYRCEFQVEVATFAKMWRQ